VKAGADGYAEMLRGCCYSNVITSELSWNLDHTVTLVGR